MSWLFKSIVTSLPSTKYKSFVTSKFSVTFASPPVARTALSSSSVLTSLVSAKTIEGKIIAKAITKVKTILFRFFIFPILSIFILS